MEFRLADSLSLENLFMAPEKQDNSGTILESRRLLLYRWTEIGTQQELLDSKVLVRSSQEFKDSGLGLYLFSIYKKSN